MSKELIDKLLILINHSIKEVVEKVKLKNYFQMSSRTYSDIFIKSIRNLIRKTKLLN